MKDSDLYLKIVEWSEVDQCYVGTCPRLFYGGCHGDDESEVYKELCEIVDENIALYKESGKPLPPETAGKEYSGKFLLRPGKELHKVLAICALQTDESLNNFCLPSQHPPSMQVRTGGSRRLPGRSRVTHPSSFPSNGFILRA